MADAKPKEETGKGIAPPEPVVLSEAEKLDMELHRQEVNRVRQRDFEDNLPTDWDSAFAALESIGATVQEIDEVIVDEWPEIDKKRLVNVDMLLMTWSMARPENSISGRPYLVVRGILRSGKRFRFTDGSAGVCKQLLSITDNRIAEGHQAPNAGLHVPHGLTVSENYTTDYIDPQSGEPIKGTTYYLNTEAE